MNTGAIGANLRRAALELGAELRKLPQRIFGNVSYRPPNWLGWTTSKWQRVERAHPRLVVSTVIGIFLVSCAAGWTWNWYQHLPKPKRVLVKVQPVEISKLEKELKYPRL